MTFRLSPFFTGLLVATATGLFFFSFPAFAQNNNWACAASGNTLERLFCSLSTEFRFIPKTLALIAYGSGVLLFLLGLLQLKDYGDDPGQTPFRDVVMKFVLGAMLISLPLAMQVVVKTVTGKTMEAESNSSTSAMIRPCAAKKSAIGTGDTGCR